MSDTTTILEANALAEALTLWVGRVVRERPLDTDALARRVLTHVDPYPKEAA